MTPPGSKARSALALAFGHGFNVLGVLAVGAFLSRALSPTEYGTYRQTFLAYDLVTPLLLLGLPQVLYVFIPRRPAQARGVAAVNFTMLFASGLIYACFLLLGGAHLFASWWKNPLLAETLPILAIYGCMQYPASALPACLMGLGHPVWVLAYNVLSRAVLIACVIGGVWLLGATAVHGLAGVVVGAAIGCLIALAMARHATTGTDGRMSLALAREQLVFSVPLGLASLLAGFSLTLDRLIVSLSCPPAQYAVYVNGAFELPVVSMVTGAITAVILPAMCAAAAAGDADAAYKLWRRVAIKSAALLFPLVALFMVIGEAFMVLLYSDQYAGSAVPFRYCLLLLPARIVVFGALFQAIDRPKEVLYSAVAALLGNSVFAVTFTWLIGPMHAALGAVGGIYLCMLPYVFWRIRKHLGVTLQEALPWRQLGMLAGISLATGVVTAAATHAITGSLAKIVASCIVFACAHMLALWLSAPYREVALKLITALGYGPSMRRIFSRSTE